MSETYFLLADVAIAISILFALIAVVAMCYYVHLTTKTPDSIRMSLRDLSETLRVASEELHKASHKLLHK